jgi:hypothetical protein
MYLCWRHDDNTLYISAFMVYIIHVAFACGLYLQAKDGIQEHTPVSGMLRDLLAAQHELDSDDKPVISRDNVTAIIQDMVLAGR